MVVPGVPGVPPDKFPDEYKEKYDDYYAEDDDEESDEEKPSHECKHCGEPSYIESETRRNTFNYCEECDDVTRHRRI
jgi:hypothetical protein